jgi:hypothetical protein
MARGPRKRKAAATVAAVEAESSKQEVPEPKQKPKKKRRSRDHAILDPEESPISGTADGARILSTWVENSKLRDRWLSSRGGGLQDPLLENGGGILRLRDYMPSHVADAVLKILEGLPEEAWELSEQAGEYDAANHRFWSADVCDISELSCLRSLFWRLLPAFRGEPTLPIFSCGRYASKDYIGRHDDRAHVPFFNDDNIYSRTVAGIWYLTRDWSESDGGHLVDLEKKQEEHLLPIYNSLAVFEVPHMHAVKPVITDRYRYSIFGWWHQQGKRYELPGDCSDPSASQPKGKKKLKKKLKKKSTQNGQEAGAEVSS